MQRRHEKIEETGAELCAESNNKGMNCGAGGGLEESTSGKNKGSGQPIDLPVSWALSRRFDFSRLRGLTAAKLFRGRPFSRCILSSLHREPDHRKRNAQCPALRQSLHRRITEQLTQMQITCRSARHRYPCKSLHGRWLEDNANLGKAGGLGHFTLLRVFSRT